MKILLHPQNEIFKISLSLFLISLLSASSTLLAENSGEGSATPPENGISVVDMNRGIPPGLKNNSLAKNVHNATAEKAFFADEVADLPCNEFALWTGSGFSVENSTTFLL